MSDELARRLSRLERAEAIRTSLAGYARAIDGADPPGLVDHFHEDATLVNSRGTVHQGRDRIVTYLRTTFDQRHVPTHHYVTNIELSDLDGARAGASSRFLLVQPNGPRPSLTVGTYRDEFVFDGDQPRCWRKRIEIDATGLL